MSVQSTTVKETSITLILQHFVVFLLHFHLLHQSLLSDYQAHNQLLYALISKHIKRESSNEKRKGMNQRTEFNGFICEILSNKFLSTKNNQTNTKQNKTINQTNLSNKMTREVIGSERSATRMLPESEPPVCAPPRP